MCNDGNSAPQSIRYLNAQLAALWENADDCAKQAGKNPNFKSELWEKGKYTRALAQYHYLGKKSASKITDVKDLPFSASFGKPTLEIICNHEVVLHLIVTAGHVNTEFTNATKPGYRIDPKHNNSMDGLQVSYRMKFSRSSIKGRDSKISSHGSKHLIQMMILDVDSAKLVMCKQSVSTKVKDALAFYLLEYLRFLRSAGNHVLFNLPDFDDDKFSPKIDYSLVSKALEVEEFCCDAVHDTSLSDINKILYDKWLMAAALGRPRDLLSICLAEISSTWLNTSIDTHFHIRFGAPQIKALCSHEVLLYFSVEDIAFFESSDFSRKPLDIYHGWKVAFIVDVVQDTEGSGTKLRLDFGCMILFLAFSARFSRHFSVMTETIEIAVTYFEKIVKFLTVDYLDVLTSYSLHIIYDVDLTIITGGFPTGDTTDGHSASWTEGSDEEEHRHPHRQTSSVVIWTERIEKLVLGGYDQVLAISERSIKELFISYYRQGVRGKSLYECFTYWKSDLFSAHFNALDMCLLSNDRAIVWVNIHDGELAIETRTEKQDFWTYIGFKKATSTKQTVKRQFSDVAIAFEVDLKIVEHEELAVGTSWHSNFKNSYLYQGHQSARASRVYKHLILDFQNAKHVPKLSITAGLRGIDREAVLKLETVLQYTREYLEHLSHHGHNIIHSVPVFTTNTNSFGLTSVMYQVVTKTKVTIETCRHAVKESEAPVILILGMCGRPMPTIRLPWDQGWVIPGQKSLGTICLSKERFLEGHLLQLLAALNRKTTIVPDWAGIVNGEWNHQLTTLENHPRRKNERGGWRLSKKSDKSLDYVWKHHEEWKHDSKHEGFSGEERHGEYSISCYTENKLSIPTYYRQGCLEVILQGESTLKISNKNKQEGFSWSKKTSAKWSASIAVYSRANGLHIEVVGAESPEFADIESHGECPTGVQEEHRRMFPSKIDLQDTLLSLKALLQGTWDYSYPGMEAYTLLNPVFTRHGDLIVELSAYRSASLSNGGGLFTVAKNAISSLVTDNRSPVRQPTSMSSIETPLYPPPLEKTVSELPVNGKAPLQPTPPMIVKSTEVTLEKTAIPNGQKGANGNGFQATVA
ncbi:hypothetical protein DFH07DRAFT_1064579 [Mycena maculata]|uniref:Uncharacterized protein n=1 Tax=Mycena maculata TaxID=230809 RepID=A0AAD7I9V6_9AGAR|nr:hypothetical protein DFH07DRAFT_1064579 [Mycena maculata]